MPDFYQNKLASLIWHGQGYVMPEALWSARRKASEWVAFHRNMRPKEMSPLGEGVVNEKEKHKTVKATSVATLVAIPNVQNKI